MPNVSSKSESKVTPKPPPTLCHHKPNGQAVVYLSGRPVYCGKYGTPESAFLCAYGRTIVARSDRAAVGRTSREPDGPRRDQRQISVSALSRLVQRVDPMQNLSGLNDPPSIFVHWLAHVAGR